MLPSLLLGAHTHGELVQLLKRGEPLTLSGVSNDTAKALVVSQIFHLSPRRLIWVLPGSQHLEEIRRWLEFFGCPVFPHCQNTLSQLVGLQRADRSDIHLLTKEQWGRPTISYQHLLAHSLKVEVGMAVSSTQLIQSLIDLGYTHGEEDRIGEGQYRRYGDTVEVAPPGSGPIHIVVPFERVEEIIERVERKASSSINLLPLQAEHHLPLGGQIPATSLFLLDDLDELCPPTPSAPLSFTAFPEGDEHHIHLRYLSVLKFYTLQDFLNDLRDKLAQSWRILIVTKQEKPLRAVFREEGIAVREGVDGAPGLLIVGVGENTVLPHSIQNPDLHCALLTDREVFTLRRETKNRTIQKLALDFITSLQVGDFVVHTDHGIGRFTGVVQQTVDEVTREYLELHYAEGDKLFVPIDQADKLSKFVHEEGAPPTLSRLGAIEWKRTMARVGEEARRIARELLEIYAKRARAKGVVFPADTGAQHEFEIAFPYQETPGQLRAIKDIKRDMESDRPMDRLICGDVGFGKTEVAMRAAFKAAQGGYQVAFITPITILADQHFHTLQRRMLGLPVHIEMLSRFRTVAEQKRILHALRRGEIDIVVGTHRVLQPDVQFFKLGLLIIDEEQRFGVKQKEQIKKIRRSVDVLTLTATPIPRTLNLALHKLRDITTITTPPPGRLPIITEVRKYSDALVRQAIMHENSRGGQVYFLHNRVETIEAMAGKLKLLIPEVSFVVTHGQLRSADLERRILDFKERRYDVLISSTIIENGIDLENANTLIVNEAEHFGLSQLYQLRGRVGRGRIQAYAFFLYHTQRLQDDAKKRLRAIVEASELGSGFQISMRDLEIRGAGEILGAGQSGHMQTVGASHFLRLLQQAVTDLRSGEVTEEAAAVEITLPLEAFIPSYYIMEEEEKIAAYQKLASCTDTGILHEFQDDLLKEYGPLLPQVQNLFHLLHFKLLCRRIGIVRVKTESRDQGDFDIVLFLTPRVTAEEIIPLLSRSPRWRVSGSTLRCARSALGAEWFRTLVGDVQLLLKPTKG